MHSSAGSLHVVYVTEALCVHTDGRQTTSSGSGTFFQVESASAVVRGKTMILVKGTT